MLNNARVERNLTLKIGRVEFKRERWNCRWPNKRISDFLSSLFY